MGVYYVAGITGRRVVPVRMSEGERASFGGAAAVAGLSFSAWVRRACLRQAELEGALAAEQVPVVAESPGFSEAVAGVGRTLAEREFRPDFGARLKR